ncbi:T9SS type A sorting domain-containing protein [Taibaiella koreensis]|uniref:T9SS type A sorting domain-containing protein n=1 Tax=Taibaiella koreensis TaxID=1268548 RepID=UPI000E599D00|nr:T9SS type A sorting domain-containing protein [Taibaiella koreensis]
MKPIYMICTGLCCLALQARAQSIGPAELNASGGGRQITGNSYEYAIGGIGSNSFVSPTLVVTPGVLQPFHDDGVGVHGQGLDANDLLVFPNPATTILLLQPRFNKAGKLSCVLYDALGRQLFSREFALQAGNERQEISMAAYAQGQYHLSITWKQQGASRNGTFKIQKIQ